jgi:hypothetical protein
MGREPMNGPWRRFVMLSNFVTSLVASRMTARTLCAVLVTAFALASPAAFAAGSCQADLDGDGSVGSLDLNSLLAVYGTSDPSADFNGDGTVGCFDLEYLLGNWGACPPCQGDADEDGDVDTADLNIVLGTWGNDCRVDMDQDGDLDSDDVDAFLCLWGSRGPLGDFDSDRSVGATDLNYLLGSFGLDCRGDQNSDGTVDSLDLNIVLGAWGSC